MTPSDGENSPELEQVLLSEIQARPGDAQLVIRLVTMYQRTARIKVTKCRAKFLKNVF